MIKLNWLFRSSFELISSRLCVGIARDLPMEIKITKQVLILIREIQSASEN